MLVQDRFDDSKHWWIDVSVETFIISNALLDSHIRVWNLKLLIMLVFLWHCMKRANVIAYLSADAENKFCTSSRWLDFGIGWMQRYSGCHPWCHLGWFNDGSIGTTWCQDFCHDINSSYFLLLRLIVTSWIPTSFQQIHPNIWRLLSMFFAKTVLFQFNLIHVSVSCCKWIVLVQDRSDDSKHWWIDVSIKIFIISNALLDSHMSVLSLKLVF